MKKETISPSVLLIPAVLGGFAGFMLRLYMLADYDWAYPVLWIVSGMVMLLLLFGASRMGKDGSMESNLTSAPVFKGGISPVIPMLFGAVCLGAASVMGLLNYGDGFDAAAAALGLISAACLGVQAFLRREGSASPAAGMVIALALAVDLISRFRHWSSDPLVSDYCFQLLACLFSMLAAFHLAGFPLGQGKRRTTIFMSFSAVFFCLICLADGGLDSRLHYGGLAVWLLGGGCVLRQPQRKQPERNPEDPETGEAL